MEAAQQATHAEATEPAAAGDRPSQHDSTGDAAESSSGKQPKGRPDKARRRTWSADEKEAHQDACRGKAKLTLGQKMEIVRRSEAADPGDHRTQAQLAAMFGKSRSAISKLLKPKNVDKLKATWKNGVDPETKRNLVREHPEFERRIQEFIVSERQKSGPMEKKARLRPSMATVCRNAENIAKELGIHTFKATAGWYARFIKRYGLKKLDAGVAVLEQAAMDVSEPRAAPAVPVVEAKALDPKDLKEAAEKDALEDAVPATPSPSVTTVTVKVSLVPEPEGGPINKRLAVPLNLDAQRIPVNGYESVMELMKTSFKTDIKEGATLKLQYKDEDGDDIAISSDHELAAALLPTNNTSAVVRLFLMQATS